MVRAQCSCGAAFEVKPELAGKQVKCPKCGQTFTVPATAPAATQQSVGVVTCSCGSRFQPQPHLAGKSVPCPKCGQVLSIPPSQPATNNLGVDPLGLPANLGIGQAMPAQPARTGLPPVSSPSATSPSRGTQAKKSVKKRPVNKTLIIGIAGGSGVLLLLIVVVVLLVGGGRLSAPKSAQQTATPWTRSSQADQAASDLLAVSLKMNKGKASFLETYGPFKKLLDEMKKMPKKPLDAFRKKWQARFTAKRVKFPEFSFSESDTPSGPNSAPTGPNSKSAKNDRVTNVRISGKTAITGITTTFSADRPIDDTAKLLSVISGDHRFEKLVFCDRAYEATGARGPRGNSKTVTYTGRRNTSTTSQNVVETITDADLSTGYSSQFVKSTLNLLFSKEIVDSNGPLSDVFVFEVGGDDAISIQAIIGGTPQSPKLAGSVVNISASDWGKSGRDLAGITNNGFMFTKSISGVGVDIGRFQLSKDQRLIGVQIVQQNTEEVDLLLVAGVDSTTEE